MAIENVSGEANVQPNLLGRGGVALVVLFGLTYANEAQAPQQQTASSSQKALKTGKDSAWLNTPQGQAITGLTLRVEELERQVGNLEAREKQLSLANSVTSKPDLSEVEFEISHFSCESEFDKSVALALADGKPSATYEGAGAMNCVQHLGQIVQKTIQRLQQ